MFAFTQKFYVFYQMGLLITAVGMSRSNLKDWNWGPERVVEIIALDDQPVAVVENTGFCHLLEYLEPRYAPPSQHFTQCSTRVLQQGS